MRTYTRSGKWLLHGVEYDHDNNGMERSQRRKKMVGRSFLGKTEQLPPSPPPSLPSPLHILSLALDFDIDIDIESCLPTRLPDNSNPTLHPPLCLVTTRK